MQAPSSKRIHAVDFHGIPNYNVLSTLTLLQQTAYRLKDICL